MSLVALAGACAAAGVRPAAAKAIAHPISFIHNPGCVQRDWKRRFALPDLRVSIGVGFESLKRLIPTTVDGVFRAA